MFWPALLVHHTLLGWAARTRSFPVNFYYAPAQGWSQIDNRPDHQNYCECLTVSPLACLMAEPIPLNDLFDCGNTIHPDHTRGDCWHPVKPGELVRVRVRVRLVVGVFTRFHHHYNHYVKGDGNDTEGKGKNGEFPQSPVCRRHGVPKHHKLHWRVEITSRACAVGINVRPDSESRCVRDNEVHHISSLERYFAYQYKYNVLHCSDSDQKW